MSIRMLALNQWGAKRDGESPALDPTLTVDHVVCLSNLATSASSLKVRHEWKWMVPIALVCLLLFANSLAGNFVFYDDARQILRNPLIQDNSLIWKALVSDVWAFKGDGTIAASNYWRPTFTAWHILNFRLFGTNPFGWRV